MNNVRKSITLDLELDSKTKVIAEEKGISQSNLLAQLVKIGLENFGKENEEVEKPKAELLSELKAELKAELLSELKAELKAELLSELKAENQDDKFNLLLREIQSLKETQKAETPKAETQKAEPKRPNRDYEEVREKTETNISFWYSDEQIQKTTEAINTLEKDRKFITSKEANEAISEALGYQENSKKTGTLTNFILKKTSKNKSINGRPTRGWEV
jgi:preprotein translocase subunit SecD